MAPIKRKRVSKKNKKSWRKNVDIKDVDNFLEDQRLEERLGIKYSEQKNEDLFHFDKEGGDVNKSVIEPGKLNSNIGSTSLRLKETQIPKCFEALVNRSAVPAVMINKAKVRKIGKPRSKIGKKILKRNLKNELLMERIKEAKKGLKTSTQKENKPKQGVYDYDVWSVENNDRELEGCSEWLSNDAIRHTLHNTGKLTKQIPKTILSKTSMLPAVEPPHPGLSYNPSLKDHTNILEQVAEAELKVIDEEKRLDRVTTKMFSKVLRDEAEKDWISEMSVGLSMKKGESDDEEGGDYTTVNPPVKNKKKTLQKRRKLKEAKLLKEKLRQQKIEKRKLSDIYKLRKFNEILNKKEEKILKNIEKRKKIKERKPFTTKVLSQTKYIEPEIDFNLAEELSGNLRNVKPEGDLLHDRFKSLQKRNILPPTVKRYVKKRKVKKYEREHTKMGWEPIGYVPFVKNKELK